MSLPRQLNACRGALPENAVISAHFFDVESGRMALSLRGRKKYHAHDIPIPRDGGINDLLEEAERPDRRFDFAICESIDRIARRSYLSHVIEHKLEEAGVLLLASDEPIVLSGSRSSQLLTRRVKQGVAEWYVMELLEKSWGGFEEHTYQGFNIGRPPYGCLAQKVPHPVPARRREGRTKHKLVPDPIRGPVVTRIFQWRVAERLSYKSIAARLNLDPIAYPPPIPTDPTRAVGRWTESSVREVLINPKHTGYMVWNRKAHRTANGAVNPPEEWVWSPERTHEALVSLEMYVEAQRVGRARVRSADALASSGDKNANRLYTMRSYVTCVFPGCGRRMFGKTRKGIPYYLCQPKPGYRPEGHPPTVYVREDVLLRTVADFFADHIFGARRRTYLLGQALDAERAACAEAARKEEGLRAAIAELDTRMGRLVRSLEEVDDPSGDLARQVQARSREIAEERREKARELAELAGARPPEPDVGLLDVLPITSADLAEVPGKLLRPLFEAFRLQVAVNKAEEKVDVGVVLLPETVNDVRVITDQVVSCAEPRDGSDPLTVCMAAPAGFEPATPTLGEWCSVP
ncbi:hypothetical protein GCM10009800_23220 [Nocardiopsis rhodophaea]